MLIEEVSQLNQVRKAILGSKLIGVDTETNFTNRPSERYCLGVSIATDADVYYIPVGHREGFMGKPNNIPLPADLFDSVSVPIIAHNMKFDYNVLRKAGIELPTGKLWDTMAMSHFICEWNKGEWGHSLEFVAPHYLGPEYKKEAKKAKGLKDIWEISPPALMAVYAEQDARLLPQLYTKLKSLMKPDWISQWEGYDREFMLLLADMEYRGIPIDRDMCSSLEQKCLIRLEEIRSELGFDPAKPSQLHPKLFSPPPYGLGLIPSSLTPTGKPKVDLAFLEAHSGHRMCALVYEYSKTRKQVSSYFSPYLGLTTRDDPRLYCNFKQYGTQTGRMSCEMPNLQQLPRLEYKDAKVKEIFLPEEGKQLWEVDFRTLEYRLMAVYSQQEELLDIFRQEGDLHQMVADQVGVDRHTAKNKIVYAIAYGAGNKTIAQGIGRGLKEGYEIVNRVKNSYPKLFQVMDDATSQAQSAMEVRMWNGRKRHFQYPGECHKAFNAVIQGGSFEIVKRSMLKLREAGFTMSNQVHDSVWLNVDSEAEVVEAQKLMEDWTEDYFGLRFSTDRKLLKK